MRVRFDLAHDTGPVHTLLAALIAGGAASMFLVLRLLRAILRELEQEIDTLQEELDLAEDEREREGRHAGEDDPQG